MMRVFVGYGYNDRDAWIEQAVFPILEALNLTLLHGKDMHGAVLQDEVKNRISQADALIAFCTLREGQEAAEFNTHPWVHDEMVHAIALGKPAIEIREEGVRIPEGLLGNRQRIDMHPERRLDCVVELVAAIRRWNVRLLRLAPEPEAKGAEIRRAAKQSSFVLRYRTRLRGVDSDYRTAKIDCVRGAFLLSAMGLPDDALIEIEGLLDGQVVFSSDWEAADAVSVQVR